MNSSNRPSKGPGVFCKLANMLGFELFDLLCNSVQKSSQGVRFVVANLTDQGVNVGYKTVVIGNRTLAAARASRKPEAAPPHHQDIFR